VVDAAFSLLTMVSLTIWAAVDLSMFVLAYAELLASLSHQIKSI
jgi:hypothetical protein